MYKIEGNLNESFYLCEGIWLDMLKKTLIDKHSEDKSLNFTCIDDCILIFEREVKEWLIAPMCTLIVDDIKNKSIYLPFKNSIFSLYGIFAYIEKIQRYKDGKPYVSGDTGATKILTYGFKNIFPGETGRNYGNDKIEKILESTRHSLMHTGNVGDNVLLNNDYENTMPVVYIGTNKTLEKIELNPSKMLITIDNDFSIYLERLKIEDNTELRNNFQKVFDAYYENEISLLV